MRSTIAALAALALAGGVMLAPTAATADEVSGRDATTTVEGVLADPGMTVPGAPADLLAGEVTGVSTPEAAPTPQEALATASRVVDGKARADDPSATIALRDLWVARPTLDGTARDRADGILARPTDGPADPNGTGYTVPDTAVCGLHVCVHYVTSTADASTAAWAASTLATMEATWTGIVDNMGYRPPVADGIRGGNALFDVYLADLGSGLYGYCAPEARAAGRTASGYCVLDNDYGPAQFPYNTPEGNRGVTAAHEFFHSVQYAYDYAEDRWMMESTATWMEERIAPDINDNRQYLPASQLYSPVVPLDYFSQSSFAHYGNWIFWEYLSTKYGVKFVRKAWEQAGSLPKDGKKYSVQALTKLLKKKGGFTKNYATFASSNLVPDRTYPEGSAYPAPKVAKTVTLSKKRRHKALKARLYHLSSATARFKPGKGLGSKKWKLRVQVNGPAKATSPAVQVLVKQKNGKVKRKIVKLNKQGNGAVKVKFSGKKVRWAAVTLVNASTRYKCNRRTWYACNGKPRDDKATFVFKARATK